MPEIIQTDVLVIGGGIAGETAALDCHERGLKTLIVVKALLGKSGCSIFAGNLNLFAPEEEEGASKDVTPEQKEESIRRAMKFSAKYTHYLGDQEYLRKAMEFTQQVFWPWIEERGLYVLRDESGAIVSDLPFRTSAWAPKMGMSGTVITDMLRRDVMLAGIPVLQQTTATRLLVKDGECVGATALDFVNGKFYEIHAKVVILATGHSNYLSLRSTGTRDGAASGWVMAYEAGAQLKNIEMQWYHASDVAYPATWMRLHLYPNPMPGTAHRSQLFNSDGEMFYDSNSMGDNPVPYIMQLKALAKQVMAGKARFDGGYYTNYTHIEPKVLDNYMYQAQFYHELGLDPKVDMWENAITWHMNVGGVNVNGQTMETGVPGLLIAGSVGSLVTGGIPNVMFDGRIAGKSAEKRVSNMDSMPTVPAEFAKKERERVFEFLHVRRDGGLLPGQVKKRIRTVIWEEFNYVKSEKQMEKALESLNQIREDLLPKMGLGSNTLRFNYDWLDALDVIDMLSALSMEIQFSLFRKESRGAFFRKDYPMTDNVNWLKHIVGYKTEAGLKLETHPVDLPYSEPDEDIADFFKVDY